MNLDAAFEKENKRVTFEWDRFMSEHGEKLDDFSDDAKAKAVELAEKQGQRSIELKERLGL